MGFLSRLFSGGGKGRPHGQTQEPVDPDERERICASAPTPDTRPYAFISYSRSSRRATALCKWVRESLHRNSIDYFHHTEHPAANDAEIIANIDHAIQVAVCTVEIRIPDVTTRPWVEHERGVLRSTTLPRVWLCAEWGDLDHKPATNASHTFMLNFWDKRFPFESVPNQYAKANPLALDNPAMFETSEFQKRSDIVCTVLAQCLRVGNWNQMREMERDMRAFWEEQKSYGLSK
jgi:hypothetical protein